MKRSLLLTVVILVISVIFGSAKMAADDRDEHGNHDRDKQQERARIERGFRIAPVPLDLSQKDPDLVGLGSYLVNAVGGCNDCHTNPNSANGGNPFLGSRSRST